MTPVLKNWTTLITTTISPSSIAASLTRELMQNMVQQSKLEQDKVRTEFLEGILERPKIKDKQQYVKLYQVMLIRLLDKLYCYRQAENSTPKIKEFYETISSHLENILDFIEDFFGSYFDRNEKVPAGFLSLTIKELSGQLEQLKAAVIPHEPYIHAIAGILVKNFTEFFDKKKAVSYNELAYQKELMDQLLADKILTTENSINEVLFYFNYNDDDYVAYLYEKMHGLTESVQTKKDKITALRFAQKNFNQLPVRLNCTLLYFMPSLKEQLNQWIEEEIKFLEMDRDFLFATPAPAPVENGAVYVHVPFRGAEIYLLHKSFLDSGGASGETYKSLFEKTGSHLTNKNQKGFSTESLQKCSDKVDYESKETVKRFLQKMIRNIDSY